MKGYMARAEQVAVAAFEELPFHPPGFTHGILVLVFWSLPAMM
jgi:hypothetical protein